MSNGISNNNDTISNHQQNDASNIIHHQQSMSNNVSLPQFYPQYINQNPPQSNIPSLIPSLNITISSPHTNFSEIFRFGLNIIIMPVSPPITTDSDTQNQLHNAHSSSNIVTDNAQTQFRQ